MINIEVKNPILSWVVKVNGKVVFRSSSVIECYDYMNNRNIKGKPVADYKVAVI
jgi:hypothetical protein